MAAFEDVCRLLPHDLRQALQRYIESEEIRLRCGHSPGVVVSGIEREIKGITVNEKHLLYVIDIATGASLHSSAAFISSGFISYHGLRIGLCGQAVYKNGQLAGFRKYSSISIRIPHIISDFIPFEIRSTLTENIGNTLIVSKPGAGKTTALREMVRLISEQGTRVSLIDERGELAGEYEAFDVGRCTDVLSFVPKAEAAVYMLRAMNPQLIAMDEISKPEDIESIFEIMGCGVNIFATVHGEALEDMRKRYLYKKLLDSSLFDNLLILSIENGKRKYTLERINT